MKLHFSEADCLDWAVAETIGGEELKAALKSGRKLRIKLGIDPTSANIHLGRSIPLWRLRAFQELGHEIHLIIGDFTGQIGDTSDKESERPMLSKEQVLENLQSYFDQFWMILNKDRQDQVVIHHNSEWLEPLTLAKISQLADSFSVNQFIKRELVAKRLESGSRVSLREMLYPLMQGYDSIVVKADVEIGGTDQRFNLLAGRILQEAAHQPAQSLIMNVLVPGVDGRKMSSSWGNGVYLLDTPTDKFGKLMRVEDTLMVEYLHFLPYIARPFTPDELGARLAAGENPRNLKLELAAAIVALYHGEEQGEVEKNRFIQQFSEHQLPAELPEFSLGDSTDLITVLVQSNLCSSKSDARRTIEQGGVRVNREAVTSFETTLKPGDILEKGKRGILKMVV